AEDGIRDRNVTGVQTCALPILINRVAEPDQLDAEVEKLVTKIVAKPRIAVAMGKEFFYGQVELSIAAAYESASQTMACNMMDEADRKSTRLNSSHVSISYAVFC